MPLSQNNLFYSVGPDNHGFYQVGNQKTYSKMEAYDFAKDDVNKIQFKYCDDVFSRMNWKIEPPIDVWELYKSRARQIRAYYDYVVIFYSGGADSDNMLQAWIDADCKIDEISANWNCETTGNYFQEGSAEITRVVLPRIKKLQNQGHKFNFFLFDYCKYAMKVFETYSTNYEYFLNRHPSPNQSSKSIWREEIEHWKQLIDSGKKMVFLWGLDKPSLRMVDGKICFSFQDLIDGAVTAHVQNNFHKGWFDELFYWTPNFPEIVVKQSHMVKRFIEACDDPVFYTDHPLPYGFNKKLGKYLLDTTVKRILYPRWNPNTYCNGKSPSIIYSRKDQEWLLNSTLTQGKRYHEIIDSLYRKLDSTLTRQDRKRIPAIYGQNYFLE